MLFELLIHETQLRGNERPFVIARRLTLRIPSQPDHKQINKVPFTQRSTRKCCGEYRATYWTASRPSTHCTSHHARVEDFRVYCVIIASWFINGKCWQNDKTKAKSDTNNVFEFALGPAPLAHSFSSIINRSDGWSDELHLQVALEIVLWLSELAKLQAPFTAEQCFWLNNV